GRLLIACWSRRIVVESPHVRSRRHLPADRYTPLAVGTRAGDGRRARLADGRAARPPRPAGEGLLPALLLRPDPPEGGIRDGGRRARVLPALHGRLDLPEAPVAEARLGEPGTSLVGAPGVRAHAPCRLPLHLQARLPRSEHSR